jgi:ankyrin repeat protein
LGELEAAWYLLEAGADVNIQNNNGVTPLDDAIRTKNKELAEFLFANGGRPNAQTWPAAWSTSA